MENLSIFYLFIPPPTPFHPEEILWTINPSSGSDRAIHVTLLMHPQPLRLTFSEKDVDRDSNGS